MTLAAGTSEVPVGHPQQYAVLAVLAIDARRLVTVETLLERVWGADPPERARRTLHTYLARIRRLLYSVGAQDGEVVRVLHRSGGYLPDLSPEQVDAHRFRQLYETA